MRKKLTEALAEMWREAENYYLNNRGFGDDDRWKKLLEDLQSHLNLTDEEVDLLDALCEDLAV